MDMEEESTNKMRHRFGKRMGRTPIDNADGSKTHRYGNRREIDTKDGSLFCFV
jgi:hypothetical protein